MSRAATGSSSRVVYCRAQDQRVRGKIIVLFAFACQCWPQRYRIRLRPDTVCRNGSMKVLLEGGRSEIPCALDSTADRESLSAALAEFSIGTWASNGNPAASSSAIAAFIPNSYSDRDVSPPHSFRDRPSAPRARRPVCALIAKLHKKTRLPNFTSDKFILGTEAEPWSVPEGTVNRSCAHPSGEVDRCAKRQVGLWPLIRREISASAASFDNAWSDNYALCAIVMCTARLIAFS